MRQWGFTDDANLRWLKLEIGYSITSRFGVQAGFLEKDVRTPIETATEKVNLQGEYSWLPDRDTPLYKLKRL